MESVIMLYAFNTVKVSTPTRSLRERAHNFILHLKDNRNFVSRALYKAICPHRVDPGG